MSEIEKFEYEPIAGFEDASAYPNTGGRESETREQMMRPHKQLRDYINNLVLTLRGVFGAGNVGTVSGESVQHELDFRPKINEVLTKENKEPYSPKSDFEPATVKFVKDTAFDVNNADMRKDVYDTNRNNRVDDSDKVNGFTVDRDVYNDEYTNEQVDLLLQETINIKNFEVLFLANSWVMSEAGSTYVQRIEIEGIKDWDCSMILDTNNMSEEQKIAAFENMFIYEIQTFSGYIVATCIECPEVDLNIKLICFAKKEVDI